LTHEASRRFPAGKQYGFLDQIRRASTSVPSNIAEGAGRDAKRCLFQRHEIYT
jgi:four helix bundle protein